MRALRNRGIGTVFEHRPVVIRLDDREVRTGDSSAHGVRTAAEVGEDGGGAAVGLDDKAVGGGRIVRDGAGHDGDVADGARLIRVENVCDEIAEPGRLRQEFATGDDRHRPQFVERSGRLYMVGMLVGEVDDIDVVRPHTEPREILAQTGILDAAVDQDRPPRCTANQGGVPATAAAEATHKHRGTSPPAPLHCDGEG